MAALGLVSIPLRRTIPGIRFLLPLFVLGVVPLFLLRWQLNVLSFGEEEASALGVDTRRFRWIIILCATLLTVSAVSVAGLLVGAAW